MIGCDLVSSYSLERNFNIFPIHFFFLILCLYIYGLNLVVFMIVCNNFFFSMVSIPLVKLLVNVFFITDRYFICMFLSLLF